MDDSILQSIFEENCILFTGAGFSDGAKNQNDVEIPRVSQFTSELATELGEDAGYPLTVLAEEYLNRKGSSAYRDLLEKTFLCSENTISHERILALPWRRIYTTNFDNVAEVAAKSKPISSKDANSPLHSSNSMLECIHINGSILRVTDQNCDHYIKLTDYSYLVSKFENTHWYSQFANDLRSSDKVFFVGYSLYDHYIKELIFESKTNREKFIIVTHPNASSIEVNQLGKFGTVFSIGVEGFADLASGFTPLPVGEKGIDSVKNSLEHYTHPTPTAKATDDSIFDLFLYGIYSREQIWGSLINAFPFYLKREDLQKSVNAAITGYGLIAVHSELGNGKSLFLEGLSALLTEENFSVFWLTEKHEKLHYEVELIASHSGRTAIVVDDYPEWTEIFPALVSNYSGSITFIVSARTSVHDIIFGDLYEECGAPQAQEIDLNILSESEISELSKLLEYYGLWASHSGKIEWQKERYLRNNCGSQIHGFLIDLLNSKDIRDRYNDLFATLKSDTEHEAMVAAILILSTWGMATSTDFLRVLLGERFKDPKFQHNPAVKQLIDAQEGKFRLRSSVAAQFLLRNVVSKTAISRALCMMAFNAAPSSESPYHKTLLEHRLMRFRRVQEVFPANDSIPEILAYFEELKTIKFCSEKPLFWLQFSIAALFAERFERAGTYLAKATAIAPTHFNTYQIDNHRARFLLTKTVALNEIGDAVANFREAAAVIRHQCGSENRHQPFRVARDLAPFYSAFREHFSPATDKEFKELVKFVLNRIEKLEPRVARHYDVVECEKELRKIVT